MNSMARPDSNDFTLAAELLGLPAVSQGFSAKASYFCLAVLTLFCGTFPEAWSDTCVEFAREV